MSSGDASLRRRLEEELRQGAERERQLVEELRQGAERERWLEEERRQGAERERRLEEQQRKTTLPEYLDACHAQLYLGLRIQPDITQSTRGSPANAIDRPRPDWILPWDTFDKEQAQTWGELMKTSFVEERHFNSLHALEDRGEEIQQQLMGSELDLHTFARTTVENPVSAIIKRLFENEALRKRFGLKGSVKFENHSNTLSADLAAEEVQSLNNSNDAECLPSKAKSRPRPDQLCVYNTSDGYGEMEYRVAALTIEYKAPHKLTVDHIREGLREEELDLAQLVEMGENESVAIRCRRLIAAVITQAFSYMVNTGVEYGEVYTGEATIFLRIPENPAIVYYSVSVPKEDVTLQTNWSSSSDEPNELHLTAVGQALPFTLRALQTPPRSMKWKDDALRELKTWNVMIKEIEETIADDEVPSSEYQPSPSASPGIRSSPIQLRPRKTKSTCTLATSSFSTNDDDPTDPGTSSRPPQPSNSSTSRTSAASTTKGNGYVERNSGASRQRNLGRFCTPQCLIGIVKGGKLDQSCPNVEEHGPWCHRLNPETFMQQMQQLLHGHLDYCEEMNIHGARGALFKFKLPRYGYTILAKATGVEFVGNLIHESAVYRRLLPIQGKYIPVHLGDMKVDNLLYYAGAVPIVHMMLLSFGGFPIKSPIPRSLAEEAICGLRAIHQLGVLQKDPAARNILVHPERQRTIWVDFERAIITTPQPILYRPSINRKRKVDKKSLQKNSNAYAQEMNIAKAELARLVSDITVCNR